MEGWIDGYPDVLLSGYPYTFPVTSPRAESRMTLISRIKKSRIQFSPEYEGGYVSG